jgi:DNA-binding NarL/FixJ family response regulator
MKKTKILIADDHTVVREGLRVLVRADAEFEVVAEAPNGREAVAATVVSRPNVILMDLAMPIMNGLIACRIILRTFSAVKVLILSSYRDELVIDELVSVGASAYLLKEAASTELLDAIRIVRDGGTVFSPTLAKFPVQQQQLGVQGSSRAGQALTIREAEVLQLIAEGFPNKAFGPLMGISVKTVEKHRQEVMDKLNIHRVAGLTRYAVRHGVIPNPKHAALAERPETLET